MIYITHLLFSGDEIETNGMDRACSTYKEEATFVKRFGGET